MSQAKDMAVLVRRGFDASDATASVRDIKKHGGMCIAIQILDKLGESASDKDKASAIREAFGTDAVRAVLSLADEESAV